MYIPNDDDTKANNIELSIGIIDGKLYHLGWDAWKDDEEYWKSKINENNWNSRKDSNDIDQEPIFKVYKNDN